MLEVDAKTAVFVVTQIVLVSSVIITNRSNVKYLDKAIEELKQWRREIQKTVDDLRVKVRL